MVKHFNVPILFFLLLLLSKEVFSYESEKIVVLCIITFIIVAYFNSKELLTNTFEAQTLKLKEEYSALINEKEDLERKIRQFWKIFLEIEKQIIEIYIWVKNNLIFFVKRFNKNRKIVIFYLVKDQLNLLIKEQLRNNQNLSLLLVKNGITNLRNVLLNSTQTNVITVNSLDYYFNKLIGISTTSNILHLSLNKLNLDIKIKSKDVWINYNAFLYYISALKF